jgi:hypothetical protein
MEPKLPQPQNQSTKIPEEGVVVENPILPTASLADVPPDWFTIKQEYIADPRLSISKLAKKYKVSEATLAGRVHKEKWVEQRQTLQKNAETKAQLMLEDKLADVKARHAIIAKFLQKQGIDVIREKKVTIRSAKTALEFIMGGIQVERQAEGLDQNSPKIVNIIAQQQNVIDKYKK